MKKKSSKTRKFWRPTAMLLTPYLITLSFLGGCGGSGGSVPPPVVDDARGGAAPYPNSGQQPQAKKGLSTGQKVAILAGAAALYYMYNQHQKAQGQGAQGQYYLSKNGQVYYRDSEHRAHWVKPPSGGIQVPEGEAQKYREFQGYNNSSTGRNLNGLGTDSVPAQ